MIGPAVGTSEWRTQVAEWAAVVAESLPPLTEAEAAVIMQTVEVAHREDTQPTRRAA